MRKNFSAALVVFAALVLAPQAHANEALSKLARDAVSTDQRQRGEAITALRALGPLGLQTLFEAHAGEIALHLSSDDASTDDLEWLRLAATLDAVSRQKDSYASGLYWYTDIEQAKVAARASGKPILSLRLLGRLDEELSCANSRFFRTVLYANTEVSKSLRSRFILHWKSVRPAPRVTIDFGDGRKIERTITGNSIHYVLDSEGRPVDALPGLYGPEAFLRALAPAEEAARTSAATRGAARDVAMRNYHNARIAATNAAYWSDAAKVGVQVPLRVIQPRASANGAPPTAMVAAPSAITKSGIELRTVRAVSYIPQTPAETTTDPSAWARIAQLHSADARLDAGSVRLIRRHHPYLQAAVGGEPALLDDAALARVVGNLERLLAQDTVFNEYTMHQTLRQWLIGEPFRNDVEALNERVYATLFLTPGSDPWLGLVSPDTYTGLRRDGIVERRR